MDSREFDRRQKMGCRSGDVRDRMAIWHGVRLEHRCGPGLHRTRRQAAGKTSTCDAVPGERKDIVQFGYTPGCKGCRATRAGTREEAHDEMCRTRILSELTRTAQGKDRTDRDEDMRQDKRARVEMHTGDGHDKPAETKKEDQQTEEAQGNGQTDQSADKSSSRKNDETSGTAEKENVQYGEQQVNVASETEQQCWKCRRKARRSTDGPTGRRSQHGHEGKNREHAD